jgi:flagellar hook-associated protein 3 FlgL
VNGGQTFVIDTSAAQTVEDLLNRLNGAGASVLAEINADGTGVNVRSRLNGADFSIGENGGATATQLGLRSFTASTRLDELNHGHGVLTAPGDDFRIRRRDGVVMGIDVSSAQTIGDVIALINSDAEQDADPLKRVTARLALFGNGIELVTSDPAATATFAVLPGTSSAGENLGLIPVGASISASAVSSGGTDTITGRDVRPFEGDGVYHALVRLRDAFRANDLVEIERAAGLLDASFSSLNFARAELGARQQSLDVLSNRLQDEDVNLRGALSKEIDVDIVQAISDLTARQASFEASLQLTARTAQLSLLDFL